MSKTEVKLRDCPPGPFLFNGSLGFKTEYGSMECENPRDPKTLWRVGHHSDVYVLASGEAFWGGVTSKEDREELLVVPVEAGALALSALPERELLREALEALEPFGREAAEWGVNGKPLPDDFQVEVREAGYPATPALFNLGDLRRARAAADKIRAALDKGEPKP